MKALVTILLYVLTLQSYAQLTWTTQITTSNSSEFANKLIKTQDGGYITVLNDVDVVLNIPQNIGYNKIAIVKLDANGNIVFNKKISLKDSSTHYISDFIELPTGELLLCGYIETIALNDTTLGSLLIKTTPAADTLWTKININNLGTNYNSLVGFANKFWTLDGIFTGQFDTLNYFIYEYDYNGILLNINYQDTMVVSNSVMIPRLFKGVNDTVIVSADWKNEGFLYKKIDTFYNKYQTAYYPYYEINASYQTLSVSNSGNITLQSHSQNNTQLYVNTNQFDSIWLHPHTEYEFIWGSGTDQWATNICTTSDGGYAMIGDTWNGIVDNIYLIKTDAMGNKQFGEMYWSVTSHNIDVVQANDGGYVMLNSGPFGGHGIWIVKTDQNGTIRVADSKFFKNEVALYPNPTNSLMNLQFTKNTTAHLTIYNIAGQQVFTDNIEHSKHYQTNLNLPNGLYILRIQTNNSTITKKLVIKN
jgi:hypothetical protein